MLERIRLSVRSVTDLVLRCGDIDSRFVEADVMLRGAIAHRKIQRAMGPLYQKEKNLRLTIEIDGIPATLQGRADGIILEEDSLTIDEIKTTTLPLDRLATQRELHLGQAKCYAHMLLETLENPPESVTVQLTYFQLDTEEKQVHRFDYSREEIAAFFAGLMERYAVWLRYERDWRETRDASIRAARFPYPAYRKGQRELAVAAYRTIERKKKLYVQAPTGIGKTLSTLFPSIKAMGEGLAEKIFYLTAKTVTRGVAEEAVELMRGDGLRFKALTLRAKEKICFCGEVNCTPEACDYARGHYDRINEALLELLNREDRITPATVEEYARNHRVCPHEMALDAALWADLVICDYNHLFDPVASLKRFFGEEEAMGEYLFLVDEAHNLPDRVREMYSAVLRKSDFDRLGRDLRGRTAVVRRLRKETKELGRFFAELRDGLDGHPHQVEEQPLEKLPALAESFIRAASDWLAAEQGSPMHKRVLELYFQVMGFAGIAEGYDSRYKTIIEQDGSDLVYTLFCLDPAGITAKRLGLARASVLFSATLTPLHYYRELLGGGEEDYILALPSPFDQERLLLCAHQGISTKYADREGSVAPIAEVIGLAVGTRRGNYLVYFPSYDYMRKVYRAFTELRPDTLTILQETGMDEEARARFLERFDAANTETLVGFCVLGGIFSEGIDLKGERLIGTVIVGVGLPGIGLRQDLIKEYYDSARGAGFDYAYVFPGMNKILQAAGRVIRSEEDCGLVVLIDSRFGTARYRTLYPAHWSSLRYVRKQEELRALLDAFSFEAPGEL